MSTPVPFPSFDRWRFLAGREHLPLTDDDQRIYDAQRRLAQEFALHTSCSACHETFTDENVFTEDGWKETQISGLCERCFDRIFGDNE